MTYTNTNRTEFRHRLFALLSKTALWNFKMKTELPTVMKILTRHLRHFRKRWNIAWTLTTVLDMALPYL